MIRNAKNKFQVMAALPELSAHCLNSVNNLNLDIHCDKRTVLKIGEFIQKIHDSNTKSGEPNIPTSQENITQLCKGQCGFFGTADNQGYCSVSTLFSYGTLPSRHPHSLY